MAAVAQPHAAFAADPVERPIRWACIGNSITQGPSAAEAYPAKLQALLGPGFQVENDGVSGRTLLKKGDYSYWTQGKLTDVFKFKPDIISIKLGTNDSKPINWDTHKGEFEGDLTALIDTLLNNISPKPKIWLVIPCPAFSDGAGPTGIRGTVIKNEVIPLIQKVAAAKKLDVIDVYTPLLAHPEFFADKVHPNAAGHDTIAGVFFKTFLSKATKLSCIGNSITEYAFGTPGTAAVDAYAVRLNMLLGRDYWVENDGKSGAYMMKTGPSPYWTMGLMPRVFRLKPNVVTIKLGTNDARAQYWNKNQYLADYRTMVDSLSKIVPKPKIWLLLPCPSFKRNGAWQFQGISDTLIVEQVIPSIKQIAAEKGLQYIDLHTPMAAKEALVPDGVHPNAEGQDSLAHIIYRAMTVPVAVGPAMAPARPAYPEISQARGMLSITLPAAALGKPMARLYMARLYGLSGRMAAETPLTAGGTAAIPLAGLAPGAYYLAVESGGGLAVKAVTIGSEPR